MLIVEHVRAFHGQGFYLNRQPSSSQKFIADKVKQWQGQKETTLFSVMTMIALVMTLCVECNTNEKLVDLLRRRPGVPPKFLGYMEDTSIEPGQKPPHGALSQDRERINYCPSLNPFLTMEVDTKGPLADVQNVSVKVRGVLYPDEDDWIAVMSPSESQSVQLRFKHSLLNIQMITL